MNSQANASSFMQLLAGQVLSRIGVGIIIADQDGRIQWVNDRQQWFTGVPSQGLLGLSLFEHPGLNSDKVHEAIQFALIKGKTRHLIIRQLHLSCRIEVSPLFIEGRLLGTAIFFYEAGHPAANAEVAGDACLDQLVADEQRAMVQMLSSLLDAMPFAVAAVARDGAVLYVNAAWSSEYGSDAMDQPLSAMLPAAVRLQVDEALESCWEDGSSRIVSDGRDGSGVQQYWVAPVPPNHELTLGLVVGLQSLPGSRSGDQALFARQLTNLCQFTARIVHDIRNPLTALMCQLELLRNENLYEPGGVHKFQGAIDLFTHQVHQINDILDEMEPLGAEESGPIDICSLGEIVHNACVVAEWRRPFKSVHIEKDIPDDLPSFLCDGLRLQKAFCGLFLNALDEAGAAGSVSVSTCQISDGDLALSLVYTSALPGLTEPLPPQPPWRSATLRLALAYAVIIEVGGDFEMRRLPGGETEIAIRLSGLQESTAPLTCCSPS